MNKFKKFKNLFSLIFVVVIMFACCENASAYITVKQDHELKYYVNDTIKGVKYPVSQPYLHPFIKTVNVDGVATTENVYCMARGTNVSSGRCEATNDLNRQKSLAIGALISEVNKLGDNEYFAATMAINCYVDQSLNDAERGRFCERELLDDVPGLSGEGRVCDDDICVMAQNYFKQLKNYTDQSDVNLNVNSPSNKELNFTKDGDYYVATFELSTSSGVSIKTTKGSSSRSGTTYTIKVPVNSVRAGETITVTATKSVTLNFAVKYDCGDSYQPVARLEPKEEEFSVSLLGTIPESKGSIKLKKVDSITEKELSEAQLSDAQFELYDSANCQGNRVGDPFKIIGTTTINDLDLSKTYSVKEIKAPTGYVLPTDDTDKCVVKTITPKVDNTEVIAIKNLEKPKVCVKKFDRSDGTVLIGAKFHVEDTNGKVIKQWTSTAEPTCFYLDYGDYLLVEDEAPDGYIRDKDFSFKLKPSDGTVTIFRYNDKHPYLEILKVDDDGAPLAGATLQLLADDKKTVVDEWVSTTAAHVISNGKIEAGKTYYLKEKAAPAGYLLNENLIEVVLENGQTKTVKFQNTKNSILIRKVDADDETKTVVGATLHIEDSNGKKIGESWVTDNNAHSIEKLEPGVYYLVEDKAPDGYVRNKSKVKFEVKGNEIKVIEVKMTNEKSVVEISKQDATTGEELPGATLKLTDEKGEIVDEWVSTDKPYIIKGLKDGKYKLTETIAPEGYTLSTKTVEFEVKDGKVDKPVVMENELTPVPSTGGTRSTLLLFVAMLDIALGIGIINYVRKTRLQH